MGEGMKIKAHGGNIYVTPSDNEEREVLIDMYARVGVSPKVVRNTYIFSREDWNKTLKASMEI